MLSCDINHPQAEDFITSKDDLTKVTGANISVKVDDRFMSIINGIKKTNNNPLEKYPELDFNRLWNKLVHQAWKTAEPGLLFWDTIIKESPADCYDNFESISTNPLT